MATQQPNIIAIMADDIGIWNIGAYSRGMMAGRTPNLDKLASEGALLTDYYGEASCTAGRSAFITGELPIRTGLTTVGQAGASVGMPAEAPTIATVLKSMGYATGQFGKNHLGDKNEYLPTVHGFDEFFGYLYHLDAMEDPAHPAYPQELLNTVGPRNMVHSWATNTDDPTVMPRWGKVGKQKIEDAGTLYPKRMETVDDEILAASLKFIDQSTAAKKPFFVWLNPTRMHVTTHLSPKYEALRNGKNGWSLQEAGMAQLDDIVGSVMQYLKDKGLDDNTMVMFTTDNGTQAFTWPDGGTTPFYGCKGTGYEGGFRCPAMVRWPGHIPAGTIQNGLISGLDWFPTFVAAAGDPNIKEELLAGKQLGDTTYKVFLDSYNQLDMLTGKGDSARHEIYYFTESNLAAVRIDDYKYQFITQPGGWLGTKDHPDVPLLTNLRLDPFERMNFPGADGNRGSYDYMDWFMYEFWRFVFVQQVVAKLAISAIDYPPMQKGASFNLDAVKAKIAEAMAKHGQ
jgi:arylsulfatase